MTTSVVDRGHGVTLGTYLEPGDAAALRARAEGDDRSVASLIRSALRQAGYLNDERPAP